MAVTRYKKKAMTFFILLPIPYLFNIKLLTEMSFFVAIEKKTYFWFCKISKYYKKTKDLFYF